VTTVYVTHDQAEAMTLGDRVAVLRSGTLQQCDDPQTLFAEPVNLFVAAFIGSPQMNLVEATVGPQTVAFADHVLPLPERLRDRVRPGPVVLGLRPSDLVLSGPGADPAFPRLRVLPSVVERLGDQCHVLFPVDAPSYTAGREHRALGPESDATVILADDARAVFTAVLNGSVAATVGEPLEIAVNYERMYLFDPADGSLLSSRRRGADARAA
jgi:multiple sugar transport system ATP-binding protein